MCEIAKVSRSGYYTYLRNADMRLKKDTQDASDYELIKEAYDYKTWKKGAIQIKLRIERTHGIIMNLKKIRRLMKKYGLVCPIRKINPVKAMIRANQSNKTYSNRVARCFNQGMSKKVLLTDITYLTFGNGKRAYLSAIKDSTTKMILSWQISLTLHQEFVLKTVGNLIDNYRTDFDVQITIHSDQGCHYTSIAYQYLLKENNLFQSMSRRGNCWDNAPQESFFAILKTETYLNECRTYAQLGQHLIDYISYYNYDRPQKGLNNLTPNEYDQYLISPKQYLPVPYLPEVIFV